MKKAIICLSVLQATHAELTCGSVKSAYQDEKCCGNPDKNLETDVYLFRSTQEPNIGIEGFTSYLPAKAGKLLYTTDVNHRGTSFADMSLQQYSSEVLGVKHISYWTSDNQAESLAGQIDISNATEVAKLRAVQDKYFPNGCNAIQSDNDADGGMCTDIADSKWSGVVASRTRDVELAVSLGCKAVRFNIGSSNEYESLGACATGYKTIVEQVCAPRGIRCTIENHGTGYSTNAEWLRTIMEIAAHTEMGKKYSGIHFDAGNIYQKRNEGQQSYRDDFQDPVQIAKMWAPYVTDFSAKCMGIDASGDCVGVPYGQMLAEIGAGGRFDLDTSSIALEFEPCDANSASSWFITPESRFATCTPESDVISVAGDINSPNWTPTSNLMADFEIGLLKHLNFLKRSITIARASVSTGVKPNVEPLEEVEYDFIVVGTGAGAVTASVLAERFPHDSILVLDAGPWDTKEQYTGPFQHYSDSNTEFHAKTRQFYTEYTGGSCYQQRTEFSDTPINPCLENGVPPTHEMSKALGGSIYHNGNGYSRGDYSVYNMEGRLPEWTAEFIDEAFRTWDHPDVTTMYTDFRCSINVPNTTVCPIDTMLDKDLMARKGSYRRHALESRGLTYFLPVMQNSATEGFASAAEKRGIPYRNDAHASKTGQIHGFGGYWQYFADDTKDQTAKSSPYFSMVVPHNSTNVKVKVLSYAEKVNMVSTDEGFKAVSIDVFNLLPNNTAGRPPYAFVSWDNYQPAEMVNSGKLDAYDANKPQHSGKTRYYARKEVILAAGYANTPAILLRSGIGDKEQVEATGNTHILNNSHVGKHMNDHVVFTPLQFNVETFDHIAEFDAWKEGMGQSLFNITDPVEVAEYCDEGESWCPRCTGTTPKGAVGTDVTMYWNTTESGNVIGRVGIIEGFMRFTITPCGFSQFWFSPGSPISEGTLMPKRDPLEGQKFDFTYFSDPYDCKIVQGLLDEFYTVLEQPEYADTYGPYVSIFTPPPSEVRNMTNAQFYEKYCANGKGSYYGLHQVGTARVGLYPEEGPDGGVIDEYMKVFGTTNLRVADSSAERRVPSGNAGGPAMMMGGAAGLFAARANMVEKEVWGCKDDPNGLLAGFGINCEFMVGYFGITDLSKQCGDMQPALGVTLNDICPLTCFDHPESSCRCALLAHDDTLSVLAKLCISQE